MSLDSEPVDDGRIAWPFDVNDSSCTAEYIEIVPLDRESDVHTLELICPVVVVKQEELQEVLHEPADDSASEDHNYAMEVRCACIRFM